MPTYEYHCDSCDRNFDMVQSFHDDPLEACPTCGSPVRKVFGSVGIVFKGSGFYKTDSRTPSATKSGDGTSTAGADDSASKDSPSKEAASDGAGSGKAGGDSGSGDSSSPTTPSKSEPASTPSPAGSSSGNGSSSGAKESAKT